MPDKPWQVEEATTEELRTRLAEVMKDMSYLAIKKQLGREDVYKCDCETLTRVELQEWLAALRKPLEGTQ